MRINIKGVVAACMTMALAACGNVSHNVAKDGHTADALVWPSPSSVTPMHKGGTFPNLANLRQMSAGLNKQQVSDLIGYPHFSEGVWGVREWNYVFNFRKPGSNDITVCQYKVLFDDERIARSFYWKPESCADFLKEKESVALVATSKPHGSHVLSADALFPFDKASMSELTPAGRQSLDQLAAELRDEKPQSVLVVGYTDRLGSKAYNRELSLRRANAVRDYLVDAGIPSGIIRVEGRGEEGLIKDCPASARQQLIACLAPNRRVEVKTDSEH